MKQTKTLQKEYEAIIEKYAKKIHDHFSRVMFQCWKELQSKQLEIWEKKCQ